jgi:hypothetical protein
MDPKFQPYASRRILRDLHPLRLRYRHGNAANEEGCTVAATLAAATSVAGSKSASVKS